MSVVGQRALEAFIKASGRTWWQAGYADGRVVNEWQTAPGHLPVLASAGLSRWEDLPKRGLRALRLLTPVGVGHLEVTANYRLFQFKVGAVDVRVGGQRKSSRHTDAHVIGKLIDAEGTCELMVFEWATRRLRGPLLDNVRDLDYRRVGPLALDVLGIRL